MPTTSRRFPFATIPAPLPSSGSSSHQLPFPCGLPSLQELSEQRARAESLTAHLQASQSAADSLLEQNRSLQEDLGAQASAVALRAAECARLQDELSDARRALEEATSGASAAASSKEGLQVDAPAAPL